MRKALRRESPTRHCVRVTSDATTAGEDMASVAQRAQKRDLGPDWRDTLAASVRRFARRTVGALLVALAIALALALATHSTTDPSFTTAAGGPPVNWLGGFGAYASDLLMLLFGLGAVLLLPIVALGGLRMVRDVPGSRFGRALIVAIAAVILIGIALGLLRGSTVSGLPAGWGGAIGLGGAHAIETGLAMIGNSAIAGPAKLSLLALLAIGGLALFWIAWADVLETDFDEPFDVIWSRDALMHVHDKKRLFAKLHALLNPGGQLVITDYARGKKPGSAEFEAYVKSTGYHLVEPAVYGKLLEEAGFTDVIVEDATPKFTEILKKEPVNLAANREDFMSCFSEADLNYLVDRWAMKVRFCDAGDMKWGIYKATKK